MGWSCAGASWKAVAGCRSPETLAAIPGTLPWLCHSCPSPAGKGTGCTWGPAGRGAWFLCGVALPSALQLSSASLSAGTGMQATVHGGLVQGETVAVPRTDPLQLYFTRLFVIYLAWLFLDRLSYSPGWPWAPDPSVSTFCAGLTGSQCLTLASRLQLGEK